MPAYTSPGSSVTAYRSRPGAIAVKFKTGRVYTYTRRSAGARRLRRMKACARRNKGLNAFIQKHAALAYEP